jgi:hypothetical protein
MSLGNLFKDLYQLEINLIESPNMTGRKMETVSTGMAQIANKFAVYIDRPRFSGAFNARLDDNDVNGLRKKDDPSTEKFNEKFNEVAGSDMPTYQHLARALTIASDATYSRQTYQYLADLSEHIIKETNFTDDEGEMRGVIVRILGVSSQLRFLATHWKTTFLAAGDKDLAELTDTERLQIRKAWEIGTNIVVMQTVAQLDGDIVSRISPAREAAQYAQLHELHRQLLSTSLNHWQVLFKTVAELSGDMFASWTGGTKPVR